MPPPTLLQLARLDPCMARPSALPLSLPLSLPPCSWSDKIHGKTLPVDGPLWAYTLHEPLGVCAQV